MNMSDASAMTEASGLTGDPDTEDSMSAPANDSEKAPHQAVLGTCGLLRKIVLAAPLSSLAVAFMVGIVAARQR